MDTIDKETRIAIKQGVTAAVMEAMELYNEKWVTGKELSEQVSMFSARWLEDFGWKLPRERIEVTDDSGDKRVTRWGYPLHQIQRMIKEGKMRVM